MRKVVKGTNAAPVKVWGVPFKAGEIVGVEIIDEDYTRSVNEYFDSDRTLVRHEKLQIQQINVKTSKDTYAITAPQWGYRHQDPKPYIDRQKANFKEAVDGLLSAIS